MKPLLLVAALTCAAVLPAIAQRLLPGQDPAFPRVRYADSLDSKNDRCIVAARKLSTKVRPVYVNGAPIGFC